MDPQADIFRLVFWLWMGIFAIWIFSSLLARQTTGSYAWWRSRVSVWVIGLAWWMLLERSDTGALALRFVPMIPAVVYSGFALTVAGFGLALWARFYLGGNWSGQIELKRDHQLIKTGPYALTSW